MKSNKHKNKITESNAKWLMLFIFILECFSIPTQYFLALSQMSIPRLQITILYFSFFTTLTNLLVGIVCGFILLGKNSIVGKWFGKPATLTAVAGYISVVSLVYNFVLRPAQRLSGLYGITNEIFHTVVPIIFLIYWLCFVPKKSLHWAHIWPWLYYPMAYIFYTLLHGIITGYYPYPIIDITKIWLEKEVINCLIIVCVFVLVLGSLIALARLMSRTAFFSKGIEVGMYEKSNK